MKPINHIRVWAYEDAPEELRDLSEAGGGEDWVALVPPKLAHDYIGWMEDGTPFGRYKVMEYEHPELPGYKVRIGQHS